jgi:hypothetical protein
MWPFWQRHVETRDPKYRSVDRQALKKGGAIRNVDVDTSWVHETPTEAPVKCDIRTGNVSIESCHAEGGDIDANTLTSKILYKSGFSNKPIVSC